MSTLDALKAHVREIAALEEVARVLSWDQEAMMPAKGAELRAEQAAAVEAAIHRLSTDARIPDWIAGAPAEAAPPDRVTLREAARTHARATKVPAELAAAIARATTLGQGVWARARAAGDFAAFAPTLARIVALKRDEASCLAAPDTTLYDALLDDHEPGMSAAGVEAIFAPLRAGLVDLRGRIAGSPRPPLRVTGRFPAEAQMALARRLATVAGYDWDGGRLDLVTHPFCSGVQGDVRITTRISADDPFNCLYSTLHETGHAIYEQGIDPALALTPAGRWASMGVHESQSRMIENQIGRSRAFCTWFHPALVETFGDIGLDGPDALYGAINAVAPGYIRTEADEVHYNLHIMMRFDLERALIAGDLAVGDLEAAWNDRFAADFGVGVPSPAQGVLQDVHWSVGLFGYFHTYTLGNIFAAELFAAMGRDLPGLEEAVARGDLGPAISWLRDRIHRHGRLMAPAALIGAAIGHPPTEVALLDYLNHKYGALYGV